MFRCDKVRFFSPWEFTVHMTGLRHKRPRQPLPKSWGSHKTWGISTMQCICKGNQFWFPLSLFVFGGFFFIFFTRYWPISLTNEITVARNATQKQEYSCYFCSFSLFFVFFRCFIVYKRPLDSYACPDQSIWNKTKLTKKDYMLFSKLVLNFLGKGTVCLCSCKNSNQKGPFL